ncbi:glycosyl transferase family 1 [Desulfocarbo indianensis]|nr:glycosyl transferase family 1 [Desulfocarbo indianensis]
MRGGEKVLEAFCRLFPQAPIYTLLHLPGKVSGLIESHAIRPSVLQRMPAVARRYRYYLPLFPLAVERLRLPPADLVLSSSHCAAKGVRAPAGALHVSYVHTPMRYVWDMYDSYFGPGRGGLARYVMPIFRGGLQRWDVRTAAGVDHFIANSAHVARRIQRHYGRESTVIHPPVDTERFAPVEKAEDYYLVVSALVPYKRVDLAVKACTALGRRLKVVGTGPEESRLKSLAGPSVEFLGWQPDGALPALYAKARAFIFPGEEDFGITPVEAMAAGRPVVALGRGGALETVVGPGDAQGRAATGRFFASQEAEALAAALLDLEAELDSFDPAALARHAAGFDTALFLERMAAFLRKALAERPAR